MFKTVRDKDLLVSLRDGMDGVEVHVDDTAVGFFDDDLGRLVLIPVPDPPPAGLAVDLDGYLVVERDGEVVEPPSGGAESRGWYEPSPNDVERVADDLYEEEE